MDIHNRASKNASKASECYHLPYIRAEAEQRSCNTASEKRHDKDRLPPEFVSCSAPWNHE